jgi:addiction module RelE/StbE family toxin
MARLTWTKRAIEDIYHIREYYEPLSKRYAEALTDQFFEKAARLERFPSMGRLVPEFNRNDIRELLTGTYRIVYRLVDEQRIDVLTVHPSAKPLTDVSILE